MFIPVISTLAVIVMIVIIFSSTWKGLPSPPPPSTQPLCSKSKKFQQRPPTGCKVTPTMRATFRLLWSQCFSIPLCVGIYVLRCIIFNCHFVVSFFFFQKATWSILLRSVRCSIMVWWHLKFADMCFWSNMLPLTERSWSAVQCA